MRWRIRAEGSGARLLMMGALGLVWGGVCFGFNGIKQVLLELDLFASECDGLTCCRPETCRRREPETYSHEV